MVILVSCPCLEVINIWTGERDTRQSKALLFEHSFNILLFLSQMELSQIQKCFYKTIGPLVTLFPFSQNIFKTHLINAVSSLYLDFLFSRFIQTDEIYIFTHARRQQTLPAGSRDWSDEMTRVDFHNRLRIFWYRAGNFKVRFWVFR